MSGTVGVGQRGWRARHEDGPDLTEVLSLRMTAADVERLNALAAQHQMPVSWLARQLLRTGLAVAEIDAGALGGGGPAT